MASTKIHCDILDIFGVDWSRIQPEQIDCVIQTVNSLELLGDENDLYGFVGTTYIKEVVAGFFIIQFPAQFISYNRDKTASREVTKPAERVFFTLLPRYGKILIQNRRFEILPIAMDAVYSRIQIALTQVLVHCRIGPVVSLSPTTSIVGRNELIQYYKASRRVKRIRVENPNANRIPKGLEYYNPQRDRNEIIRDSRSHDYPRLKSVDIRAKENEDLRNTHIGKDLVYAVTDSDGFLMVFEDEKERTKYVRRTNKKTDLEFSIDVDTDQLSQQTILQVIDILNREVALEMNAGEGEPELLSSSNYQIQMNFGDDLQDEDIEGDNE